MKKERGNGYGSGTFIDSSLFLSPAYLSLGHKGTAPKVASCSPQMLTLLLAKRKFGKSPGKKGGGKSMVRTDGNRLTLTYAELESKGILQTRATRGFDELLAKGFIEIVHQGGAFDKDKTVYALTMDYINWRVGHPAIRVRVRDIRRGYQKRKDMREILQVVSGQGN